MYETYFPVLVLLVLATGFAVTMLLLAIVVGPKKITEVKQDSFECGTIGTGDPDARFSVKFYLVAVIFILFDIEIVYLFPWAVQLRELGWEALYAIAPFFLLLLLGLAYEWKRGVLDWND